MNTKLLLIALATVVVLAQPGESQVQVSGLSDFVARNSGEVDRTNVAFTGASNLHTMRTRLFFDAPLEGDNAAFVQLLLDDYTVFIYGAYVRMSDLFNSGINMHVGIIPNTVGSFAPRTYSNVNPLVGVPLLWMHHSSYVPKADSPPLTVDELLVARDTRSNQGLPLLYDNCWNTGIEVYASKGSFDFSIAALTGSISKPTISQKKDMPQFTARVANNFGPDLSIGLSGFFGPYLYDGLFNDTLPTGKQATDYMSAGAGYDLSYSRGYFEIHSELFYAVWEHPYLPDLKLASGYIETKYKFTPGWFAAGRVGFFEPMKLTASDGSSLHWDYPVKRFEFGVGYHPSRRTVVKAVTQLNRFDFTDAFDTEHYMLQLSVKL